MRVDLHAASAPNTSLALSFAARERRAQRELLALCGVALVALATVAVSLSGQDFDLAASGARSSRDAVGASGPAALDADRGRDRSLEFARTAAREADTGPALHSDDAPPALVERQRAPQTGAQHAAKLRAIQHEATLLEALDDALRADQPAALAFAALEVAYERLGERSAEHFWRAARDLTHSSPNAESVGRAGVTWLSKRATSESNARHVLLELSQSPELAPALRASAAVALVQSAPLNDLARFEGRLLRDGDPHVAQCVESALAARRTSPSGELVALEPMNQE